MSQPPDTVLQVQCGSCLKIVNVPAAFLDKLLLYKMYNCPHCKSRQSINLDPQQETSLRFQARQILIQEQQQQAAAAAQAQAAAMLQQQRAQQQQAVQQQAAAQQQVAQHMAAYQRALASAHASGAATTQPGQPGAAAGAAQAAAILQALQGHLQQMSANRQQQGQQQHQQQPAGASGQLSHSQSAAALQHLMQMQQQMQQHNAAVAAAQAARGGAGGMHPSQSAAALAAMLQQHAQQQGRPPLPGLAGLSQAQLAQLMPFTNGPDLDEVDDADESEVRDTFMEYQPAKLTYGQPHPDAVVETASLAAVEPPDIKYELKAHEELVSTLSALQLESVVYACQRHQQTLPDGSRGGFFIGDGAGVGKGRTIAGLILENWRHGRRRHLWLSVGSDLKVDTKRDLDDVGAPDLPVHALNKLPYGKLAGAKIGVTEGVIFCTYSSLISSSDSGRSRFKQLVEWCGPDFDGLIVFDESHKAKNLVPEVGTRGTQVGMKVWDLQKQLPRARVVYCSATGASEPRNMGYMVRLGLWGEGNPAFIDFPRFLEVVQGKAGSSNGANMAALELVAMDMKAQGMYVCRTLSFAGAEFETVNAPLEEPIGTQYAQAAATWNRLFREFLYAEEQAAAQEETAVPSGTTGEDGGRGGRRRGGFGDTRATWRSFWAAHQAFFRHMTMAAKVPAVVRMAQAAVASGRCAVIGLQSTGEARTADVVAERGEELDDFVSGPKELLIRLVENYYPMPPDPNAEDMEADSDSDEEFEVAAVAEAMARNALEGRDQSLRGAKARSIRYKEFSESEDIGNSSSEDDEDSDASSSSSADSEGDEEAIEGGEEAQPDDGTTAGAATRPSKGSKGGKPAAPGGKAAVHARKGGHKGGKGGGSSGGGGSTSRGGRARAERRRSAKETSGSGSGSEEEEEEEEDGSGSGGSGSGDEYDPTRVAASSANSQSGSESESDASKSTQRREEKRAAKRAAAELRALRRQQAEEAYAAALKRREAVLAEVQKLELPMNPLDTLIDQLGGPSHVAEMTGRKGRLVRSKSSAGVVYEMRNASGVDKGATLEMINVHERELFLKGTKLIAIISEAASTGISLHADRRCGNQRRRVHLTLELPWSADKAIQQFGRTHRANQAHGPQYRLIFTPLGGERRFAAAVARRLESLGALTQGDRRAGPSLSAYNYESVWGQQALREMYLAVMGERPNGPLALPQACRPGPDGEPPRVPLAAFLGKARALLLNVGIIRHNKQVVPASHINIYLSRPDGAPPSVGRIDEKEMTDVPRFLNRLLGLEPVAQQSIFDFYQATLEALMDKAKREGTLDEGIVDIKARSVSLVGQPRVLHKDATTGASTVMYEIELDRGLPWQDAQQLLEKQQQEAAVEEGLAAAGLTSPVGAAAMPAVLASVPAPEGKEEEEEKDEQQQQEEQIKKTKEEKVEEKAAVGVKEEGEAVREGEQAATAAALAVKEEQQGAEGKPDPNEEEGDGEKGKADVAVKEEGPAAGSADGSEQQQAASEGEAGSDQQPTSGALPAQSEQQEDGCELAAGKNSGPKANGSLAGTKGAAAAAGQQKQGKRPRGHQEDEGAGPPAGEAGGKAEGSKRRREDGGTGQQQPVAKVPGKPPRQSPPQQQQESGMIDLTLSDSEGEAAVAAVAGKGKGKQQQKQIKPEPSDSDVVMLTDDGSADGAKKAKEGSAAGGSSTPAKGGKQAGGKRRWESGCYRAKQEGINRQVHVLLALQIAGSQPPTFHIYRPATGRSRQNMTQQELKARYSPLEPSACRPLWDKAYEAAGGGKDKDGKQRKVVVSRTKRLHILGGAVMRCWGVVQAALKRHAKSGERRMRVLRIATTGDAPQRLVGMLLPEAAVEEVTEALQGEGVAEQADGQADGSGGEGSKGSGAAGDAALAAAAAADPKLGKAAAAKRGGKQQLKKGQQKQREEEEEQQQPVGRKRGRGRHPAPAPKVEEEEDEETESEDEQQQQQPQAQRRKLRGQAGSAEEEAAEAEQPRLQRQQPARGGKQVAVHAKQPARGGRKQAAAKPAAPAKAAKLAKPAVPAVPAEPSGSSGSGSDDEAEDEEEEEEETSETAAATEETKTEEQGSSSSEEADEQEKEEEEEEEEAPPPLSRRRQPARGRPGGGK